MYILCSKLSFVYVLLIMKEKGFEMANLTVNIYSKKTIEKIAELILKQFDIDPENIEVIEIARKFGLNVYSADLGDSLSGFIKKVNGVNNIFVNNNHAGTRQRFTIAHEIGHFVLHNELINTNNGTVLFRGLGDNWEVEDQADYFAAALLMPLSAVEEVYNKLNKNISATARVFRVSEQAMRRRLIEMRTVGAN